MGGVERNDILRKTATYSFDADKQENQEEARGFRAVTEYPYGAFVHESQQDDELYNRWYG